MKDAVSSFGDIHILVNNAGVSREDPIEDSSEKDLRFIYEVNVFGAWRMIKSVLPTMKKNNKGHIVNISSVSGTIGIAGMSSYSSSKFALYGLDESVRMELRKEGSKIRTTCVCPYFIDTGMFKGFVPSKVPLILPLLKTDWIGKRVVDGLRQDEVNVIAPFFCKLHFGLREFATYWFFDFTQWFIGSMDTAYSLIAMRK